MRQASARATSTSVASWPRRCRRSGSAAMGLPWRFVSLAYCVSRRTYRPAGAGPSIPERSSDKVGAVLHGSGLQGAKIRAGIGFTVALAPDRLTSEDARQVLLFLLLRAVPHDRRPQKACGVAAYHRRIEVRQLLVKNKLLPERP